MATDAIFRIRLERVGRWASIAVLLCVSFGAYAHHAYVEYDQQRTVEIEGTLTRVAWQNPHTSIRVEVRDADGKPITWSIESVSINALRRMTDVPLASFRVGERVKIAGWPSKRSANRLFGTNLLSLDGHELITWRYSKPRWSSHVSGFGAPGAQPTASASSAPSRTGTLFQVWSYTPLGAAAEAARAKRVFPLTEAAKKKVASRDPTENVEAAGCRPKGMPLVMFNPFPIEFVDKGDRILLRIEMYDLVRTIHMRADADGTRQPATLLGFSKGRWEGTTLVVETSRVDYPFIEFNVPQSLSSRLIERFVPSADGSRLDYTLTVTDPETLTAPVQFAWRRVWRPGEAVMPYNCVSED